jgi:REP element-mobilizing transposase RayT
MVQPLYTIENCSFSSPLEWGVSVFWREPNDDESWIGDLIAALEPDGIRVLGHRYSKPGVSQFMASTGVSVSPMNIVQRIKGRLQYVIRSMRPKALKGNYAIRSIGQVTRQTVEQYVSGQIAHHAYADPRFAARLQRYQISNNTVNLAQPRWTSHGCYWFNLHIVLVHRERWAEADDEVLSAVRSMVARASEAKRLRLARAGIFPDHIHMLLGCPIEATPLSW